MKIGPCKMVAKTNDNTYIRLLKIGETRYKVVRKYLVCKLYL